MSRWLHRAVGAGRCPHLGTGSSRAQLFLFSRQKFNPTRALWAFLAGKLHNSMLRSTGSPAESQMKSFLLTTVFLPEKEISSLWTGKASQGAQHAVLGYQTEVRAPAHPVLSELQKSWGLGFRVWISASSLGMSHLLPSHTQLRCFINK